MSLFKKKSLTVNCVVLSFESVLPLFTQVLWPRPFGNSILHFHLQNGITESTNLTGCWGASEALCGVCLARSLQSLVLSECLPSLLRNVTTILCPSYITSQHSFTSSRPEPNDVPGEEPIPLLLLFSCSVVSDSLWPMDCTYGIQASGWEVWKSSWEILIHPSYLDGIAVVTEQKGKRPYEIQTDYLGKETKPSFPILMVRRSLCVNLIHLPTTCVFSFLL